VERTNSRGEDVTTPESASTAQADTTAAPRPAWSGPYLFRSDTGQRPYFVYTPTRYQAGTRVPLVVMLHGCSQTPRGVAVTTRWNELAEERNFIVVYPAQPLAVSPDAITGAARSATRAARQLCRNRTTGQPA
jgi:poly(3-hydroxybutyrate) depolymerase